MKRTAFRSTIATIVIASAFVSLKSSAQVVTDNEPYSFTHLVGSEVDSVIMRSVDPAILLAEDQGRREQGILVPYRYGAPIDISLGLEDAGTWEDLPNGARLWRMKILSSGASLISLVYEAFEIPPGGEFFVYNEDRSTVRGAFTVESNPDGGSYATPLTRGPSTVLEYYEPAFAKGLGRIRVSRVIHGFRGISGQAASEASGAGKNSDFGDSAACHINVNCSEGDPYRDQQRSLVLIHNSQGSLCSGSLVNNQREDHTPYILTANHCLVSSPSIWIFYFNYESPNCSNTDGPLTDFVSGASIIANDAYSDFALLKFAIVVPKTYNAFYAGWSAAGVTPSSTAGIHHPNGDIKKISLDDDAPAKTAYEGDPGTSHWEVSWDDGITASGSSGSPLFDQNKRIVGQLNGGTSFCSVPQDPDWYGRFFISWDYGSSSATRLKEHLDPDDYDPITLDGKNDTRPDAPTNLVVSGCMGCMPDIDWNASTSPSIDHYELWRLTSPEGWNLFNTTSSTSWTDSEATIVSSAEAEDWYCYKVRAVSGGGYKSDFSNDDCVHVEESPPWRLADLPTDEHLSEGLSGYGVPSQYILGANYPNPFNPRTDIRFGVHADVHVVVDIYDVMGRQVEQLVNQRIKAGFHVVHFDAQGLPSGIYIYRLQAGNFTVMRRMVLLK